MHFIKRFAILKKCDKIQKKAYGKGRSAMNLNQLEYFCTAVRSQSITQAAKKLYVTQPAISGAIRELEKEFSVNLFPMPGINWPLRRMDSGFMSGQSCSCGKWKPQNCSFTILTRNTRISA